MKLAQLLPFVKGSRNTVLDGMSSGPGSLMKGNLDAVDVEGGAETPWLGGHVWRRGSR